MNKTIIISLNVLKQKKKPGTNIKVQGHISKNVESARTNDIFKLKNNE